MRSRISHSIHAIPRRHKSVGLALTMGCVLLLAAGVQAGILEVSWDAPTTNTDGTPLTDLLGYRVYYGISSSLGAVDDPPCNADVVSVGNVTTLQLTDLTEGTIYFVRTTAIDSDGNESLCSNEASASARPDTTGGGGGAGGGASGGSCFIATAAYGSPLAEEVQVLRAFRDRALLPHAPGRLLVAAYYRVSPPVAKMIRQHKMLRAVTRGVLWPVVWGAQGALAQPALALTLGGGALLAGPLLLVWVFRTRRARIRGRTP